ncbi:lysophospholipid acyltransferase family protein [Rhodopirellula sallentina]|uniref:Phospholipid/glycerol acyltransferase n=1 Tax=Rhodopirellula sallentina SM41 TaxID=1263870 RepID=M5UCQ8_9BACT|nr:lysophospholipid acyltransferase family protein [Rhodopirellula sallentina]EMI53783.1 phospholipid/glycerol acyltransferase [Rhodopirellula sallentina SM41]
MTANAANTTHDLLDYHDDVYASPTRTTSFLAKVAPSPYFYAKFLSNVLRSSREAKGGRYDGERWSVTSHEVLEALESVGVRFHVSGVENIRKLESPCVFVANHMSMLETIILPAIIQPVREVTFVVKQSLLDYPVFCHILRARDPIAVSRANPREDLKAVMKGGVERLNNGVSIVVFPQTTRAPTFDPTKFNTIGAKLAARAGVPIVPIALQTDAWGNGKKLKDFGAIDAAKTVRFAFGEPIEMSGRGTEQHQQTIDFIQRKIDEWNR